MQSRRGPLIYSSSSKYSAGQSIVAGWHYQWVCQLSWASDSCSAPVDVCHTFRHMKQTFGWTTPKLATPEQSHR